MCTLSWFVDSGAYHVFFNRDEDLSRPRAVVPSLIEQDGVRCVMPADPKGGGTWVATNQFGFTFALLNYYQGKLPKGRLRSRGQIVKGIATQGSLPDARAWLERLELTRYAPFSLLIFPAHLVDAAAHVKVPIPLYRWNGKEPQWLEQESPLFSSAIAYEEVTGQRQQIYHQYITHTEDVGVEQFEALHKSHLPDKSQYSICMHRADAATVSFSHVKVTKTAAEFHYIDGPPCEKQAQPGPRLLFCEASAQAQTTFQQLLP